MIKWMNINQNQSSSQTASFFPINWESKASRGEAHSVSHWLSQSSLCHTDSSFTIPYHPKISDASVSIDASKLQRTPREMVAWVRECIENFTTIPNYDKTDVGNGEKPPESGGGLGGVYELKYEAPVSVAALDPLDSYADHQAVLSDSVKRWRWRGRGRSGKWVRSSVANSCCRHWFLLDQDSSPLMMNWVCAYSLRTSHLTVLNVFPAAAEEIIPDVHIGLCIYVSKKYNILYKLMKIVIVKFIK